MVSRMARVGSVYRGVPAVAGVALLITAGLSVSPAAAAAPSASPVARTALVPGANGPSYQPTMSADGRFVAFVSSASNLVAGDTNDRTDVFLRDTESYTTVRVSVSSTGEEGNDDSFGADVSADGRFIAFSSSASNLVAGDTNNKYDTFLHDTRTGVTTRVNVSTEGRQDTQHSTGASVSGDGRFVAFSSLGSYLVPGDTNYIHDVFVRDTQLGTTTRVSVDSAGRQADDGSSLPRISSDGRFIAFTSRAANLVAGDTNNESDIFLRDIQRGTTTRVTVDSAGHQADDQVLEIGSEGRPAISGDGRFVTFVSSAANLVTGDTNRQSDVFVRDTQLNTTTRVSVSSTGEQGNGRAVDPAVSASGRFIVFVSGASNLAFRDTNGKNDVFLRDTQRNTTGRVSIRANFEQASDNSEDPAVSADGILIAFDSSAPHLVADDDDGQCDVFVRDRAGGISDVPGTTRRISQSVP